MTAADLLEAIDAADSARCAQAFAGLEEKVRRALHPAVERRVLELETELRDFANPSRTKSFDIYAAARVAFLGVATLGELKQSTSWTFVDWKLAFEVLANRRPVWLSQWAEFELARNFRNWMVVRSLVRAGSIPRPDTEFYVLGMIAAPHQRNSPRRLLEQDPTLMSDELWRLFEHEGSGELSLAAYDKYVQGPNRWFDTLLGLAADGSIDRARVLNATLDALERDFAPFRAGWFSRLHESLKPGSDERRQLCERYLALLRSRVPATVSFAMKALVETHKTGGLDVLKAASRLAPAFEARDKGTVERALTLIDKSSRNSDAATKARLAVLAIPALAHDSADIQNAVIKLTQESGTGIADYLDLLTPSVRARLGVGAPAAVVADYLQGGAGSETELRVTPIGNLNELVETFAAVLENQGPPVEIERVIDGVARLGIAASRGEAGFERLTAGLAKRAEKLVLRAGVTQPRAALAELALAWTRARRSPAPQLDHNLSDFLLCRTWCASEQAALRVEQPLLSLPTSPDGCIEPAEFQLRLATLTEVQRTAAESDRESLFHLDFLLARLRAKAGVGPVRIRLIWNKRSWEVQGKTYCHYQPSLEFEGLPKASRFNPVGLTIAKFSATLEMKRWCASISPRWRQGWFAAGCRELGNNLDWWEANWSTRAYLESLLNPRTPLDTMGAMLIALGLGAKEPVESGLATDALIAAVAESRLDTAAIGDALIEAADSGAIKFTRWAKQLEAVAKAGTLQAKAVFLAIEALLESAREANGRDFGALVVLEHELAHLAGLRLTRPDALRAIAKMNTGGKLGRAAKGLLELSSPGKKPRPIESD